MRVTGQARLTSGLGSEYECMIEWRRNGREAAATLDFMN